MSWKWKLPLMILAAELIIFAIAPAKPIPPQSCIMADSNDTSRCFR